jgi:hypothetical protein
MAGGGPIESITLKGRRFAVDAESDMDLNLSGFTNEVKPNGDGSSRVIKSRRLAMAKGGALVVDNDRSDNEFLQEVSDEITPVDADITLVDGTVYSGNMSIVGEFVYKTKDAICEIELCGTMTKQ